MMTTMTKELIRFAKISYWEAWSYIVLLFIAMPLKYFADWPMAVKVVGMLHGVLFIAYCLQLLFLLIKKQLSFAKSVIYFIASLLPFAAFWVEKDAMKLANG